MFSSHRIPYSLTASFSGIVLDYLSGNTVLAPFYAVRPDVNGIRKVMDQKQHQGMKRETLVHVLRQQYKNLECHELVEKNIQSLLMEDSFTVCTAHQPNLFTGPLYFVYKILHAVRLSSYLKEQFPAKHFVPVYYMGSEDADIEELNHFHLEGKRYTWNTKQKGAVGKMTIDADLLRLIDEMNGQLSVLPYGNEWIGLLKKHFTEGVTIQTATLGLVNALFGRYGLVVLIADHPLLKKQMATVFEDDLLRKTPSSIVTLASEKLNEHYSVQAFPRDINLFYLREGVRERIQRTAKGWEVLHTDKEFTEEELLQELNQHPEHFSPNVILRGLYQETLLPNVAFIGGGGELAYWLQLKTLFEHYYIPFPALVLRNSFLLIDKKSGKFLHDKKINPEVIFQNADQLFNNLLYEEGRKPQLNGELDALQLLFDKLKSHAGSIDPSLGPHVEALKKRALKDIKTLESKMLRAERKKHNILRGQIIKIKERLFPKASLQERVGNVGLYFAMYGPAFLDAVYHHSPVLEQEFTLLYE